MAIGSEGEVGKNFKSCRDYTMEDWEKWWQWMRENWHPNLMAGYASTILKKEKSPFYGGRPESDDASTDVNTTENQGDCRET